MKSDHVLPLRVYLVVFGTLLVLTGLTTAVAYVDLGFLNTPIALSIASVKLLLVVLYFMHVRYSSRLVRMGAVAGFLWLIFLFVLTMGDYATRGSIPGWR